MQMDALKAITPVRGATITPGKQTVHALLAPALE
jgi:hypothetical protein